MATAENHSSNGELQRLKKALEENDKLMREAALKYENLVAAKEDLIAAVNAHKESRLKKGTARRG